MIAAEKDLPTDSAVGTVPTIVNKSNSKIARFESFHDL